MGADGGRLVGFMEKRDDVFGFVLHCSKLPSALLVVVILTKRNMLDGSMGKCGAWQTFEYIQRRSPLSLKKGSAL